MHNPCIRLGGVFLFMSKPPHKSFYVLYYTGIVHSAWRPCCGPMLRTSYTLYGEMGQEDEWDSRQQHTDLSHARITITFGHKQVS